MWPWSTTQPAAPPDCGQLTYVIGDIHGCTQALLALLDLVAADAQDRPCQIVTLGDHVDRGPDSAGTLRLLHDLDGQVMCLMGNHDQMLLSFLDDPMVYAPRWLPSGGAQTLHSFGVSALLTAPQQADALARAMGDPLIAWLRACPLWWQSGNVVAVHAYTDPALPMNAQPAQALLWGRPPRRPIARADGTWVIHGHTIVPKPSRRAGHIAIDTGAYRGNPLTAAVFDGGSLRFLQAQQDQP